MMPWWSSDGSWFDVAMFENHDTKRIFRFDMATQEFTPLASFGWFSPTLPPERDRLAILANVYNDGVRTNKLQVMTLGEILLGSFDIGAGNPVWSPDGQWIAYAAYTSTDLCPSCGGKNLELVDLSGDNHRQLPTDLNVERFAWSPLPLDD